MKSPKKADSFPVNEARKPTRRKFVEALAIDREDLDECLIRQPELLYHVAEQYVLAEAERDAIKLELEEAIADEDNKVRALAERNSDKVTEPFIRKQIIGAKRVKALNQELLDAKMDASKWAALHEAFNTRGRALNKLVDLYVSRVPGLGASVGRAALADNAHRRITEERLNTRRR